MVTNNNKALNKLVALRSQSAPALAGFWWFAAAMVLGVSILCGYIVNQQGDGDRKENTSIVVFTFFNDVVRKDGSAWSTMPYTCGSCSRGSVPLLWIGHKSSTTANQRTWIQADREHGRLTTNLSHCLVQQLDVREERQRLGGTRAGVAYGS